MARWTVNSWVRVGARSVPGRFALRVARDLGRLQFIDRGMTLAAHVFTAILPILLVAGALRSRLSPQSGPILAEHLGLNEAAAEILERSLPGGAQELRATGIIGVVVLVIAATSFSRALERSLQAIWHTPAVGIRYAWRWLVAILSVVAGVALVVAARVVLQGSGALPVIEFIAEVAIWTGLWWTTSWIVINRTVSLRELLPGSLLAGVGFAVAGVAGRVVLPPILADSAVRFGVLGMAFTYIGWLLVLSCIFLTAAVVGRVAYLAYTGRAWRQSAGAATPTSRGPDRA